MSIMDERTRFVAQWLEGGESMAELCRRHGISRTAGYKWTARYEREGPAGLEDRSRARLTQPHAVPDKVVEAILSARAAHPTWGPAKLLAWLAAHRPRLPLPSCSTAGDILRRHGLTVPRRRARRATPSSQPLAHADAPGAVWCVDFKGWFRTGDGVRCDPLTLTDACSRYLLRCRGFAGPPGLERTMAAMEAAFREHGIPARMRSDNGPPFGSTGLAGLTRLSAWWIRLGIAPERIEPGKPQQNGRHERFHLTLKRETASPPASSLRRQQERFDAFAREYNGERPHQALGQRTPASVHAPCAREWSPAREPQYPGDMTVRRVHQGGRIKWNGREVNVTRGLECQPVGLLPVDEGVWDVYYGPVRIGVFDERRLRIHPPSAKPAGAIEGKDKSGL